MAKTLEYIDSYFSGNLSDEEKAAFEIKCETDPEFAEEVGFYISARRNIRKYLYDEKIKEFDELYIQLSSKPNQSLRTRKSRLLKKMAPYFTLTAACLLLVLGWMVFFHDPSPQQLASNYIENNLQNLPIPMNDNQDSLQLGIAAFNRQDYPTAEKIFLSLSTQDYLAPEAIKNLGILYLINDEYDKALLQFNSLSNYSNLRVNQGPFLIAVTLMKRDKDGDQKEAKVILQEVSNKGLSGNTEAEKWIEVLY